MDSTIVSLWQDLFAVIKIFPIDLVLVVMIAFMFGRFVWVMWRRTRLWDGLSYSLIAVFISCSLAFLYSALSRATDQFPGEYAILWIIRIGLFVTITWSQHELNKELSKAPRILFVRDRNWVDRHIDNSEQMRAVLTTTDTTPPGLIQSLDTDLREMYRFQERVRDEDRRQERKAHSASSFPSQSA